MTQPGRWWDRFQRDWLCKGGVTLRAVSSILTRSTLHSGIDREFGFFHGSMRSKFGWIDMGRFESDLFCWSVTWLSMMWARFWFSPDFFDWSLEETNRDVNEGRNGDKLDNLCFCLQPESSLDTSRRYRTSLVLTNNSSIERMARSATTPIELSSLYFYHQQK